MINFHGNPDLTLDEQKKFVFEGKIEDHARIMHAKNMVKSISKVNGEMKE
jgi:hypothetical protein